LHAVNQQYNTDNTVYLYLLKMKHGTSLSVRAITEKRTQWVCGHDTSMPSGR